MDSPLLYVDTDPKTIDPRTIGVEAVKVAIARAEASVVSP